jgi:CspA family cold shock protein
MPTGTVKFFHASKGFGFVVPDAPGPDAFLHNVALQRSGIDIVQPGDRLEYQTRADRFGGTGPVFFASGRLSGSRR